MLPVGDLLGLGLLGGCVALDRTAFLQGLFSRPLVAGTLAGLLLGAPELGLLSGLFVELLWLMQLPVGASVPPDDSLAGVLAAVFAVSAPAAWGAEARATLGVLLALPCGCLGRTLDVAVRRWNDSLAPRARRRLEEDERVGVGRYHLLGAARFFGAGVLATVVGSGIGVELEGLLLAHLPAQTAAALEIVALLVPVVGAGAVMARIGPASAPLYFTAGLFGAAVARIGWRNPWPR